MNNDLIYYIYRLENQYRMTRQDNGAYVKIARSDAHQDHWTRRRDLTEAEALRRLRRSGRQARVIVQETLDLR